jgi:hypothetical protein
MDNQSSTIETLIDRAKSYAETRLDLLKLKTIDKSSSLLSLIVSMFIVILIVFFAFIFLSIGLAILLGKCLGELYYGFFILAAIYLIAGLVLFSLRDKLLKTPIANSMIKKLLD